MGLFQQKLCSHNRGRYTPKHTQSKSDQLGAVTLKPPTRNLQPCSCTIKSRCVWMSVGAKHHLKSDLTSEVAAFQLTENNWAIVSREQLSGAAWCPASSAVHPPPSPITPLAFARPTSCFKHTHKHTHARHYDCSYDDLPDCTLIWINMYSVIRSHLIYQNYRQYKRLTGVKIFCVT